MKFMAVFAALFAVFSMAIAHIGPDYIKPESPPITLDIGAPENVEKFYRPLNTILIKSIKQDQPNPPIGYDGWLQLSSDREAYALVGDVIRPNFNGWKDVDFVAVGGFRLSDNVPATGFGLEYKKSWDLIFVKAGAYGVLPQKETWRLVFGISGGIRFVAVWDPPDSLAKIA